MHPHLLLTFSLAQDPDLSVTGKMTDPDNTTFLGLHALDAADTYMLTATYTETAPEVVQVDMVLTRETPRALRKPRKTVISSPRITTRVGEEAQIIVESDRGEGFAATVSWP